jgi:hypothetical protein
VSGRWTSKDASRFQGGPNLFLYALGDPVNYVDVDGQSPILVAVLVAAAIVAILTETGCEAPPDCKFASAYQLRKAGITLEQGYTEHSFKQDYLHGISRNLSKYDICACSDGSIQISEHGQCGADGAKIQTGVKWK